MKHLKTFESVNKYKKYLIIKSDRLDILYYILMNIVEQDDNTIKYEGFTFYYNYGYDDNGEELKIRKIDGNIAILNYQILYQTDDFDDSVKNLNLIIKSDKFNL